MRDAAPARASVTRGAASAAPPIGAAPGSELLGLRYEELAALLASWGHGAYHARRLWRWLYAEGGGALADSGLRPDLLARLAPYPLGQLCALQEWTDQDQTRKWLLAAADGVAVEAVLMRFERRTTACVSTQAGCAMGCVFCATGQRGLERDLRASEIVAQVLHAARAAGGALDNLVLMGMGEPLANYDAVAAACAIVTDRRGLALAPRRVTLSTVGLPDGIRRMTDDALPYQLALSLCAVTDQERNQLVPIGRRHPLAEVLAACREYCRRRRRRLFVEWTLIPGHNDTPAHAAALHALLGDLDAHVNVIPLNPSAGCSLAAGAAPDAAAAARRFQDALVRAGRRAIVRLRRGLGIAAGCGQLAGRAYGPR